jgi:hypothetical protein
MRSNTDPLRLIDVSYASLAVAERAGNAASITLDATGQFILPIFKPILK